DADARAPIIVVFSESAANIDPVQIGFAARDPLVREAQIFREDHAIERISALLGIIKRQHDVTYQVVGLPGLMQTAKPKTISHFKSWTDSPGVRKIRLIIAPSNSRSWHKGRFASTAPISPFEQQVGQTVPGHLCAVAWGFGITPATALSSTAGNCDGTPELRRVGAAGFFIFLVVAIQNTNLKRVLSVGLRKVVFPDPEILPVLPRRYVPEIRPDARERRTPENRVSAPVWPGKYFGDL